MKPRDLRGFLLPAAVLLALGLLAYSNRALLDAWFTLEPLPQGASSPPPRRAGSAGSTSDRRSPAPALPPAGSAGSRSDREPPAAAGSGSSRAGSGSSRAGSGSSREAPPPRPPDDDIAHWTCSMHPSVRQPEEGTCPICAMDLTPVTREEAATGQFQVDAVRRQRIGVRTTVVELRPLTRTVRAFGALRADEGRVHDVTLRVEGWIQRLHVRTTGAPVEAGAPLLDLYSPALYAAEREYLQAFRRSQRSRGGVGDELLRSAASNLRLSGLPPTRIQELRSRQEPHEVETFLAPASGVVTRLPATEGSHLHPGQLAMRIEDLSTLWMEAEVFQSDLPLVRAGQPAGVVFPPGGLPSLATTIDYVYPTLAPRSRAGRVRAVLPNPEGRLRPGMEADLVIEVDLGEHLVIPAEAVVFAGSRRLVFQDLGGDRLRPRIVQLGPLADGFYPVEYGLTVGDRVVTSGNFLLAAESRIRSAETYWGGDDARE